MPVSVLNDDDSLRMLMNQPAVVQESTASLDPLGARDMRRIETLIRLMVRDEVQRHVQAQSPDVSPREAVADDGAPTLAPVGAVDDGAAMDVSRTDVMNAEDVAAFLGVDRNTVYDYAGRGTIPCRRLGKRLLFHRPALVSWLDPCKAASTRKV